MTQQCETPQLTISLSAVDAAVPNELTTHQLNWEVLISYVMLAIVLTNLSVLLCALVCPGVCAQRLLAPLCCCSHRGSPQKGA